MDRLVIPAGHGDFDAAHKAHAQRLRLGRRRRQPTDFVVIGEREQFDTVAMGPSRHFGGRKQAVRDGRMAVEVGIERFHPAILTKPLAGPAGPRHNPG